MLLCHLSVIVQAANGCKIGDFRGLYHNIDIDRVRKKITEMRKTGEMVLFKI